MTSPPRPLLLIAGIALLGLALALLIFGNVLFGSDEPPAALPQIPQFTQPEVGVAELAAGSGEMIDVGDTAYAFALPDLDGNTVRLSDFHGRPVMLNFWATWCLPCRVEMPELEQALNDYAEQELVILALNQQESAEAVADFFDEFDLSLTPLLDSDGTVGRLYSMINLPGTVFINPDGQVTAVHRGMLGREEITRYLAETIPDGG